MSRLFFGLNVSFVPLKFDNMKYVILLITGLFSGLNGFAQCNSSNDFTGWGVDFLPETVSVYTCAGCGDHTATVSLRTFTDTALTIEIQPGSPLDITVFADRFRLDSIAGLPAGLTYNTNSAYDTTYDAVTDPFGYWVNGGDTIVGFSDTIGCIEITGAEADWVAAVNGGPNSDGIYPLVIFLDARVGQFDPAALTQVVPIGSWLTELGALLPAFGDPNFTEDGIRYEQVMLDVNASGVGVEEIENGGFNLLGNYPNPALNETEIRFNASESTDVEFNVFDILGNKIHTGKWNVAIGSNSKNFNTSKLSSGIYVYTMSNGTTTQTRKMIVQ